MRACLHAARFSASNARCSEGVMFVFPSSLGVDVDEGEKLRDVFVGVFVGEPPASVGKSSATGCREPLTSSELVKRLRVGSYEIQLLWLLKTNHEEGFCCKSQQPKTD